MGQHYLPQFYLRGFTAGNTIWVHDRLEERSFQSQRKAIANENKLYPTDLEQYLANSIEEPAKAAIESIRKRQPLEQAQREALAQYIVTLWKRVPEGRRRVAENMPEVAASVKEKLHRELDFAADADPSLEHLKDGRKAQVDEILARYIRERPPDICHDGLAKQSSSKVIESLLSMEWRFLCSDRFKLSDL